MAQETFAQIWNKVLLYAPDIPVPLVQEAVKRTYREVIGYHYWSQLKADGETLIPSVYNTGTVDIVQGSTTVTGTVTAWTTAMIGRQFLYGSVAPFYTITAVDAGLQTLTLDRAFALPNVTGGSYEIGQYYIEFPTNLGVLLHIRERNNSWQITPHYYTQEYIDRIDPYRQSVGTPVAIVAAPPRRGSDNVIIPRYELWPRVQAETLLMYHYYKGEELVNATDRPIDVLRPEVLVYGALKDLSMWPGTGAKANPLFNSEAHKMYKESFDDALHDSEMADLDLDQRMIDYTGSGLRYPMDMKYWQNHPF